MTEDLCATYGRSHLDVVYDAMANAERIVNPPLLGPFGPVLAPPFHSVTAYMVYLNDHKVEYRQVFDPYLDPPRRKWWTLK